MPLKTTTLTDGSNTDYLGKIDKWLQNQKKKPTCAFCGEGAQWDSADIFYFSRGLTGNTNTFVALTCSCGYSIFLQPRQAGMNLS